MRYIFSRNNGNLGEAGCVGWMFSQKGMIAVDVEISGKSDEEMFEMVIEAGAEDLQNNEDVYEITTDSTQLDAVRLYLDSQGIRIKAAELTQIPQNTILVTGEAAKQVIRLVEALEDNDDVQNVYTNADIPDTELD
jgi:transcriptional/translational regulatory protein YebC/TACO1